MKHILIALSLLLMVPIAANAQTSTPADSLALNYLYGLNGVNKNESKGIKMLKKAVGDGLYRANYELAKYYLVKEDYKNARTYLDEGVRLSEPHCLSLTAEMYFWGQGVSIDEDKARQIASDAASRFPDVNYCQLVAGTVYCYDNEDILGDTAMAIQYWKHGIANGSQHCLYALADFYKYTGLWSLAYPLYYQLVTNKSPEMKGEACFELARMNYQGYGCEEDVNAAVEWARRGVDEYNDKNCAALLAAFYEDDSQPIYDLAMSEKYYEKAIELGLDDISLDLARVREARGNIEGAVSIYKDLIDDGNVSYYQDIVKLYASVDDDDNVNKYLEKGSKAGDGWCSFILGRMYEDGIGDKDPNYKKAAECYKRAAKSKNLEYLYGLPEYYHAMLYLYGRIGKMSDKDIAKGIKLIERSIECNNTDAHFFLAYCYENGLFVPQDMNKALQIYSYYLDDENELAAYKIALCHESGEGGLQPDSAQALYYMNKAAEWGSSEAMCWLGDCYREGRYVEKDQGKAFSYYKMADDDDGTGAYYIARSFLEGCGVPIDTVAAMPYLWRAVDQGVGEAAYSLAGIYDRGTSTIPVDGDSALAYYITGYQLANSDASYVLGVVCLRSGMYGEAYQYFIKAHQWGNDEGTVMMAQCRQQGIGVEADPEDAYKIFEEAAKEKHSAGAYCQMGLARLQGRGCNEDDVLGKMYLDTAVALGSTQAMFYLGLCYIEGLGCESDSVTAVKWISLSAEAGNLNAVYMMGRIFESQEDYATAVEYYQRGAEHGDAQSCCTLGRCYEQGHGVKINYKKAYELYLQAAEAGSVKGCRCVASCFLEGIHVEKNAVKAVEWLSRAAEMGDAESMYEIGHLYEYGQDNLKADKKTAREWYKKAAAAGFGPAQSALGRM